ncbi:MAG: hypothetical protein ABS44_10270 [Chryseobacterium sp. SCN 40-13]|nr:MAG: hypothetical protein ABS44_10270 [Chryseobacterium sp. SCN 40-13]
MLNWGFFKHKRQLLINWFLLTKKSQSLTVRFFIYLSAKAGKALHEQFKKKLFILYGIFLISLHCITHHVATIFCSFIPKQKTNI